MAVSGTANVYLVANVASRECYAGATRHTLNVRDTFYFGRAIFNEAEYRVPLCTSATPATRVPGFAYAVPAPLQSAAFHTRTYESIRKTRPRVIEILRQVAIKSGGNPTMPKTYVAINKINNALYIGVTCGPLAKRRSEHFNYAKRGGKTLFAKAIRKYGPENFEFITLAVLSSYERALYSEQSWIAAVTPEYNLTAGGEGTIGYRPTAETLEKLSLSHKGKIGPWAGKKMPRSSIEKRTATRRARGNYIGHSRGQTRPPSDAMNTTIGRWGAPPRKVQCVDDGKIFEKVKLAAAFYGVGERHIRSVLSGKRKATTVCGFTFRYVDRS